MRHKTEKRQVSPVAGQGSVAFTSGSRQATVSFTLAVNEFKTIITAVQ